MFYLENIPSNRWEQTDLCQTVTIMIETLTCERMSQHTPRSSLTYVDQGVPFFSMNKTNFSHLVQPSRNVVKVSQNHEFYFCSLKKLQS